MGKQGSHDPKKPGDKPAEAPKAGAPAPHGGHAVHAPSAPRGSHHAKVGCHAVTCKEKDVRYNFCEEHFRQFKFGLITKAGDRVLDYERKLEHYQNWIRTQSSERGKVA